MKVIDAMQKITNGEEFRFKILSENKTYHVYKDSQVFDEEDEDYVQWFIDYDWLNEEIEIIEEEPRNIKVCGSLFTRSEYNKLAGIEEDKKIENNFQHVYYSDNDMINANFENIRTTLKNIINVINEMREDK